MPSKRLTKAERMRIYNMYGGRCAYCGKEITYREMQVDHVKPVFRGWDEHLKQHLPDGLLGTDEVSNYHPSCRPCNFRKSTSDIEGFRGAIEHGITCLKRDFTYRMMLRYGLVEETPKRVLFHFEQVQLGIADMPERQKRQLIDKLFADAENIDEALSDTKIRNILYNQLKLAL